MSLIIESDDDVQVDLWAGSYFAFTVFRHRVALLCDGYEVAAFFLGMAAGREIRLGPALAIMVKNMFRRLCGTDSSFQKYKHAFFGVLPFFYHSDREGAWTPRECCYVHALLTYAIAKLEFHQQLVEGDRFFKHTWSPIFGGSRRLMAKFCNEIALLRKGLAYCIKHKVGAQFC